MDIATQKQMLSALACRVPDSSIDEAAAAFGFTNANKIKTGAPYCYHCRKDMQLVEEYSDFDADCDSCTWFDQWWCEDCEDMAMVESENQNPEYENPYMEIVERNMREYKNRL